MKLSEMEDVKESKKIVEDEAKRLQNMSQDELMVQFLNEVNKQKKDGTFDIVGLKSTIESMKNFLPQQSYENIMKIVNSLE